MGAAEAFHGVCSPHTVEFLRSATRARAGRWKARQQWPRPSRPAWTPAHLWGVPAEAGNVEEGSQGAARVSGQNRATFETPFRS